MSHFTSKCDNAHIYLINWTVFNAVKIYWCHKKVTAPSSLHYAAKSQYIVINIQEKEVIQQNHNPVGTTIDLNKVMPTSNQIINSIPTGLFLSQTRTEYYLFWFSDSDFYHKLYHSRVGIVSKLWDCQNLQVCSVIITHPYKNMKINVTFP